MECDEQFVQWWNKNHPDDKINTNYVVEVCHALQGHPESPHLYEQFVNDILERRGFRSSKHAPCLYHGKWKGKRVLLARQTDDFASAAADKQTLIDLYEDIDSELKMVVEKQPMPLMYAVSINQTHDYNQLNMEIHLNQLVKKYEWLQGIEPKRIDEVVPIPMKMFTEIDTTPLPTTTAQIKAIEKQEGVNYRSLFGQLLFPMVCCRPDICPHISKLGQVLTAPAAIHYQALKAVAVYLIQTRRDGPIYWRRKPRLDLPKGDFKPFPIAPENLENSPWDPHGATALAIPHFR
jgi:hypothetical protein